MSLSNRNKKQTCVLGTVTSSILQVRIRCSRAHARARPGSNIVDDEGRVENGVAPKEAGMVRGDRGQTCFPLECVLQVCGLSVYGRGRRGRGGEGRYSVYPRLCEWSVLMVEGTIAKGAIFLKYMEYTL